MITDKELDEIHGAMSDEELCKLSEMRGGCCCHLSPPCNACVKPLTEFEAEALGLLEGRPIAQKSTGLPPECHRTAPVDPDAAMRAVRAMCGDRP